MCVYRQLYFTRIILKFWYDKSYDIINGVGKSYIIKIRLTSSLLSKKFQKCSLMDLR